MSRRQVEAYIASAEELVEAAKLRGFGLHDALAFRRAVRRLQRWAR